jgi:hypothetical protein
MLNAMCVRQGIIQLAFTFNQPLALSTQDNYHSIEVRRETSLVPGEAET